MSRPGFDHEWVPNDDDIKLLYEIVTTAEASNDLPFRALFAAYNQVLTKYGISKDHDKLYFRFLLHMGEGRNDGYTLFERFRALLERMGVQIDFEPNGDEDIDDTAFDAARISVISTPEREAAQRSGPRRLKSRNKRRVSFDSAYNTVVDTDPVGQDVPVAATRPHSTDILQRHRPKKPLAEQAKLYAASALPNGYPPTSRSKYSVNKNLDRGHNAENISHSLGKNSKEKETNPQAVQLMPGVNGMQDGVSDTSDGASDWDENLAHDGSASTVQSSKQTSHRALIQMVGHAKTLRYHHLAAKAIGLFRHWRDKTGQAYNERQGMLHIAISKDTETLSRQALEQWRSAYQQRRHEKETDAFFAILENKAMKARDLFLLTKAFSHWAQSASEEVQRTNAARRHILKTRYFNTWRDITVVNELKVRRHGLRRFIASWKRRTAQVLQQQEQAARHCDHKVVDRFYKRWFWNFCERRAPAWYALKLKASNFSKWINLSRRTQVSKSLAVDFRALELLRSTAAVWARRSQAVQGNNDNANGFRRTKLVQPAIESLQREVGFVSIHAQVVQAVDTRIVRSALTPWVYQARVCIQAAQVNNLRTLRNAWTAWNDRLRAKALSRTIDDRILQQALYRWVLMERQSLFQRVQTENLTKSVLGRWKARTDALATSLGRAQHALRHSLDTRLRVSVLNQLLSKSRCRRDQAVQADHFHSHCLLSSSLKAWTQKFQHIQKLQTYSSDARFYVLTKHSLKKWQAAATANQRARRREAYSATRRKTKTALARKILLHWRSATTQIAALSEQAIAFDQERFSCIAIPLTIHWHDRTVLLQQAANQATSYHDTHLLSAHLTHLLTTYANLTTLSTTATIFQQTLEDSAASSCLRRLNWHLFQHKRAQETADSLVERNQKKHFRNMIRYWKESTERRKVPVERVLFPSPAAVARQGDGSDGAAAGIGGGAAGIDSTYRLATTTTTPARAPTSGLTMGSTLPPHPQSGLAQNRTIMRDDGGAGFRVHALPPSTATATATATAPRTGTGPIASVSATPAYMRTPSRRNFTSMSMAASASTRTIHTNTIASRMQTQTQTQTQTQPWSQPFPVTPAPAPTSVPSLQEDGGSQAQAQAQSQLRGRSYTRGTALSTLTLTQSRFARRGGVGYGYYGAMGAPPSRFGSSIGPGGGGEGMNMDDGNENEKENDDDDQDQVQV